VNAAMEAEADPLCGGGANSRNGYQERSLIGACKAIYGIGVASYMNRDSPLAHFCVSFNSDRIKA